MLFCECPEKQLFGLEKKLQKPEFFQKKTAPPTQDEKILRTPLIITNYEGF